MRRDLAKVHAPHPQWPQLLDLPAHYGDTTQCRLTACSHLYDPGIVSDLSDEWTCKSCLRRMARMASHGELI